MNKGTQDVSLAKYGACQHFFIRCLCSQTPQFLRGKRAISRKRQKIVSPQSNFYESALSFSTISKYFMRFTLENDFCCKKSRIKRLLKIFTPFNTIQANQPYGGKSVIFHKKYFFSFFAAFFPWSDLSGTFSDRGAQNFYRLEHLAFLKPLHSFQTPLRALTGKNVHLTPDKMRNSCYRHKK